MSRQRIGALIVIERHTALGEYAATGVLLDAMISPELLVQIFWPNTPLHDGAVLIRRGRLYAAACILPLPEGTLAPEERLGLRHRAAIGITQRTDALFNLVRDHQGTPLHLRTGMFPHVAVGNVAVGVLGQVPPERDVAVGNLRGERGDSPRIDVPQLE